MMGGREEVKGGRVQEVVDNDIGVRFFTDLIGNFKVHLSDVRKLLWVRLFSV